MARRICGGILLKVEFSLTAISAELTDIILSFMAESVWQFCQIWQVLAVVCQHISQGGSSGTGAHKESAVFCQFWHALC
jgi:hypothetical protein